MKILILIGGGRSGIDLLQSLFDQHTQVSQFPGVFKWNEFNKSIKDKKSPKFIATVFTKKYRIFFDSRKNKRERHNKLGSKKNEFYKVSEKKFIHSFKNFSEQKKMSEKNILLNLHLAYSFASGEDIKKKIYNN